MILLEIIMLVAMVALVVVAATLIRECIRGYDPLDADLQDEAMEKAENAVERCHHLGTHAESLKMKDDLQAKEARRNYRNREVIPCEPSRSQADAFYKKKFEKPKGAEPCSNVVNGMDYSAAQMMFSAADYNSPSSDSSSDFSGFGGGGSFGGGGANGSWDSGSSSDSSSSFDGGSSDSGPSCSSD